MSAQVIKLHRTAHVRADLIDHYETMLARARCGMVEGCIDLTQSDGEQFIAVCGNFADDRALAQEAASRAMAFLSTPGSRPS